MSEAKQQNKLDREFTEKVLKAFLKNFDDEGFPKIRQLINKLTGLQMSDDQNKYVKELMNYLIPSSNKNKIKILELLNSLYYFFHIFYPGIMHKIESYIISSEGQEGYNKRIIDFLVSIQCRKYGSRTINRTLGDISILQCFFINIVLSPKIIQNTRLYLHQIFEGNADASVYIKWLERQGILIVRVLKILTSKMSEMFSSCLNNSTFSEIYSSNIFDDLLSHIVDIMKQHELPHISKLAFLHMLVWFTVNSKTLFFSHEQLKTILEMIETMLKHDIITDEVLLVSANYLFTLGKAGLKIINTGEKLLILDPNGNFEFTLSMPTNYRKQIVKSLCTCFVFLLCIEAMPKLKSSRTLIKRRYSVDSSDQLLPTKKHRSNM